MRTHLIAVILLCASCSVEVEGTEDVDATSGTSIGQIDSHLTGCQGHASSSIPADGDYVMTTFGGGSDTQRMSCGGLADGTWYYVASRQRYGCGSHVQITANGKCVVAETDDYGPDVCVENAAGMPIIDSSPAVSRALFGVSGLGWSDHVIATVTEVPSSTPLGPCASPTSPPPPPAAASCSSSTLARDVPDGTCVQSAGDGQWYDCSNGAWVSRSSSAGCASAYAWCNSATLGETVPPRTCVQAASNEQWYQCNGQGWVQPVDTATSTGPIGACSSSHPL